VRFGGVSRILIHDNDLTNSPKRCLWSMTGDHSYIAGNRLNNGRLTVGPCHVGGDSSERFLYCVIEGNIIDKTGYPETAAIEIEHGAHHAIVRNNVVKVTANSVIAVRGYSAERGRRVEDLRVFNNTGICPGTSGRFLSAGHDVGGITIANNLFAAPNLITGDYQKAILFILESDLANYPFIGRNVWPIPAGSDWQTNVYHYLWPTWAHPDGCKDDEEWAVYEQTHDEVYHNVQLDGDYRPQAGSAAIGHAARVPGVYADFNGDVRPASGVWTAGAVEVPQ
jgi:hypothetical protein